MSRPFSVHYATETSKVRVRPGALNLVKGGIGLGVGVVGIAAGAPIVATAAGLGLVLTGAVTMVGGIVQASVGAAEAINQKPVNSDSVSTVVKMADPRNLPLYVGAAVSGVEIQRVTDALELLDDITSVGKLLGKSTGKSLVQKLVDRVDAAKNLLENDFTSEDGEADNAGKASTKTDERKLIDLNMSRPRERTVASRESFRS